MLRGKRKRDFLPNRVCHVGCNPGGALLVCPTCPSPAFKFGEKSSDPLTMYLEDIFTIAANLAGVCGISLPCGWTAPQAERPALPIGLQLLGPSLGEAKLLRAARACEQALAFPAQPR